MATPAILALEDGSLFYGQSIGISGETTGEVVFNTAMTGYQEILTDPSYKCQIVTLTYPHIGSVGTNQEDEESPSVMAAGLVIRDRSQIESNWRSEETLTEYLTRNGTVAIAGIDTRRLTRNLRKKGAQGGCIVAGDKIDEVAAIEAAKSFPGLQGMDLVRVVTTQAPYNWEQGSWELEEGFPDPVLNPYSLPLHVVVYDYGVKRNILRMLVDCGCRLQVVPADTPVEEVLSLSPDGVFLSNGPGDPEPCDYAQRSIKRLLEENVPLFGICLGHQLLSLASGARTMKMKFGHHGANHPVQDLESGKVMITSQNHGFAVDDETLPENLKVTHRSLFDHSLQGVERTDCPAFSFQGHPEASPGPHDVAPLFDHFIELIKQQRRDVEERV
jgi:carbamoyl-phosphate synthase small subunit|tara:strand:+ start:874 stop:2034 length:1161 start_codon:yes stop_codon:yes gene_type:complete